MQQREHILDRAAQKAVQALIEIERKEWPPATPWSIYQPHRPETKPAEGKAEAEK